MNPPPQPTCWIELSSALGEISGGSGRETNPTSKEAENGQ
jgi:hypothetical protein